VGEEPGPRGRDLERGDGNVELTSPVFENKGRIPTRCTCDGEDQPPELHRSGIPEDAVELALMCEDVDAPGGTFVHWVVWGLDPSGSSLGVEVPAGTFEGLNDFDRTGYGGPCPPPGHGYHHYHFRLYALSEHMELPHGSTINELRRTMDGKVLATAELVGLYVR
jgi:hypothetical protein